MPSLRRRSLPAVLLVLAACAPAPLPHSAAAPAGTEGVGDLALLPPPDTARDAGAVLRLRSAASGYVTAFDFSPRAGLVRRVPAAADPGAASPRVRPGETTLPAAPPLAARGPGAAAAPATRPRIELGGRSDALADPPFAPTPATRLGLGYDPAPSAPTTAGAQRVLDARSTVVILSARPLTAGQADAIAAAVGTPWRAGEAARELARRVEAAAGPVQWTLAPR